MGDVVGIWDKIILGVGGIGDIDGDFGVMVGVGAMREFWVRNGCFFGMVRDGRRSGARENMGSGRIEGRNVDNVEKVWKKFSGGEAEKMEKMGCVGEPATPFLRKKV